MLAAEDELFKGIARRMEINGLAVRKARFEGLKGDALRERIAELSSNPTDEMFEKSLDYARYLTFQRPLGPTLQAISMASNRSLFLKMMIPFIRTPSNILSYAAERSPIAFASKRWRQDFAAGGARRDLALAKVALGTGLGLMAAEWAADGTITGAMPRDRSQADLMKADGWQPYSVKVGDKYISYARLDPLSTTLSMAADLADAAKVASTGDAAAATDAFVLSIIDQIDNKTFLSGISDFMKIIDPRGQGSVSDRISTYAGRQAGSFAVPAGAAGPRRRHRAGAEEGWRNGSHPSTATGIPAGFWRLSAAIDARCPAQSRLAKAAEGGSGGRRGAMEEGRSRLRTRWDVWLKEALARSQFGLIVAGKYRAFDAQHMHQAEEHHAQSNGAFNPRLFFTARFTDVRAAMLFLRLGFRIKRMSVPLR